MDESDDDQVPVTSSEQEKPKKSSNGRRVNDSCRYHEQQILSALATDVDTIQRRFLDAPTNLFRDFAASFIKLEMPTIFLGRLTAADLVEFSELLLAYAASFMFSTKDHHPTPEFVATTSRNELPKVQIFRPNKTLKERIFGVFFTYCLYFTQPTNSIANVKLSVNQMWELREFCENELASENGMEALFCLNRLIDQHAFMVKPFEAEFNPLLARKFTMEELTGDGLQMESVMGEPLAGLKSMAKDFTLAKANVVHNSYTSLKAKSDLPKEVHLVQESLLSKINAIVAMTEKELASI